MGRSLEINLIEEMFKGWTITTGGCFVVHFINKI